MAGSTPIYGLPYPQSADLVSAYPALGQSLATTTEDVLVTKVAYNLPKNAQTGTTYTFALGDAQKLVTASNASSSTYTIPPQSSVVWTADTVLRVVNYGAGTVTFAGGAGVTVTNTAATLAQYASCALVRTASDAWTVVPFSGGASTLTSGDVSATTGSPTITTSGGYTIYKFTGSGSMTFSKAGLVTEILVCGGGGGGTDSATDRPGGGAFAFTDTNYYVSATSHTITVGAKGAQNAHGSKSLFGELIVGGGLSGSLGNSGTGVGAAAPYGGIYGAVNGNPAGGGATGAAVGTTPGAGLTSSITGSSVEYGKGGANAASATVYGQGGKNREAGFDGVVIVKVVT